jgi:hypothetical protein
MDDHPKKCEQATQDFFCGTCNVVSEVYGSMK